MQPIIATDAPRRAAATAVRALATMDGMEIGAEQRLARHRRGARVTRSMLTLPTTAMRGKWCLSFPNVTAYIYDGQKGRNGRRR